MSAWRDLPPVEQAITIDLDEDGTKHVSQTFLRLHDRCERAAYLYLKYDGGTSSIPMNRGEAAHRAFAKITNHAIEENEEQVAPEIGQDFLLEVWKESPELVVSAGERDYCRALVWNFCAGKRFRRDQIVAVEQTLQLRLGNWTLRGRVDFAEMPHPYRMDVEDYKTARGVPKQEEFEGDFQTQLYALLMAFGEVDGSPITLAPLVEEFGLRQTYPVYLREDGSLADRFTTISRVELTSFRLDLESQLQRLELNEQTQKWEAVPGSVCEECPCEAECPLPRHLRPDSQLTMANETDAQKLAEWVYLTRRRTTRAAARLKAWAKHNHRDTIPIGEDHEYAFVQRDEYPKLDRPMFLADVEGAVEYGHPIDLDQYRQKRTSDRFEIRKKEADG